MKDKDKSNQKITLIVTKNKSCVTVICYGSLDTTLAKVFTQGNHVPVVNESEEFYTAYISYENIVPFLHLMQMTYRTRLRIKFE